MVELGPSRLFRLSFSLGLFQRTAGSSVFSKEIPYEKPVLNWIRSSESKKRTESLVDEDEQSSGWN